MSAAKKVAEKLPMHQTTERERFNAWYENFKIAQNLRDESEAQTWAKKWWGAMDWNLRNCLLLMVCGDMAERYNGLMWSSIPLLIREDLMLVGRTIERSFRGAPWR